MNKRLNIDDMKTEEYRLGRFGNYTPARVNVGDETGFLMVDTHGFVMPKEDFQEFVRRANLAYEAQGIDNFIQFNDFKTTYPRFITRKVDGKYLLPKPVYHKTEFRKDIKKDWSFKCAWCKEKVSSKTDTTYFVMRESFDPYEMEEVNGRFCQEACAENYWYEKTIEFVMDKKMTDYIHTDKRIG